MSGSGMVIAVLGVRWHVDLTAYVADDPRIEERLIRLWSRACTDPSDDDRTFRPVPGPARSPGTGMVTCVEVPATPPDAFPYAFSRALTRAAIEERAGSALLLHAAGLASHDGERAVALVAPSGTGKTTASRILGRRFGYLSDELVSIEPDLTVGTYPKPLSLKVKGHPGGKDERSPDELGLAPTPTRAPDLAALVLLRRDESTPGPKLTRAPLLDALLDLVGQSCSIWVQDRPLQQLAEAASRGGGPFVLRYTEISTCHDLVSTLLEPWDRPSPQFEAMRRWTGHAPADEQRWVRPMEHSGTTQPEGADAAHIVRARWSDAVEIDDEVLLLVGPQPIRLTGLGATIWLAAAAPVGVEDLTAHARERHGPHPDASRLVREAVDRLVEGGVLRSPV